ncbi:unnamed protein product [Prorocentrum cordatum]|uniref:Uncharacterized protein n=1 Tax=Prorocentrum cordatum TaxID=2364126 RepID=A0ABN9VHU4_9DINO|nr:unnamed protein product [Polarella glacialis]
MPRARCELSDHDLQAIVLEHVAEVEAMKTEQGDAEYTIKNNMGLMGSLMSVARRVGHVPLTKAILAKTVLAKEQAQKHGKAISYAVSYVCAKERNMATAPARSSSCADIYSARGRGSPRRLVAKTPEKKKGAPACVDLDTSTLKGHVDYDAFVYVIEDASGRREYPLARGDRGFCMAGLGGGGMAHVHTEMPNLLLDEKEKMLAKRASRDKAKAAAKARAECKKKTMKTALKRPAGYGAHYVEMCYKASCSIAVRQKSEPKRQVASSGGARYKDCDVDAMRAVGREAVALMGKGELGEDGAASWMTRGLTEKFGK